MYFFANSKDVSCANKWCRNIILNVQNLVRDYFTFDIKLIGSGEKKLVTQNWPQGFDLDYNIVLQKDKKGLISDPMKVKLLFEQAFDEVLDGTGFNYSSNKTSVLSMKRIIDGRIKFSFDVAILIENNDGYLYKIKINKYGAYWAKEPKSRYYVERYQYLKDCGKYNDFKNRYLELKNFHLSQQDGRKSFSIFLETLNEFEV